MTTVLLIVHLFLAIALVAMVLVQRSEGGALGIGGGGGGGGGGGLGGLMSSRGTANFLTRTTAILAGAFMMTSLALALLSDSGGRRSIVDEVERTGPTVPGQAPTAPDQTPPATQTPAAPATPSVPLSN